MNAPLDDTRDPLTADDIAARLQTRWLGRHVSSFETVTSTNDVARRLAEAEAPDGMLVIAERQTAGRGRRGGRWHSAPGLGIWCTFVVPATAGAGAVSHLVAMGICAALASRRVAAAAKWPNDVLAASPDWASEPGSLDVPPARWPEETCARARKIAGILVEQVDRPRRRLIVGAGVNVHHREADFASDLAGAATSVFLSAGGHVPRALLLADILAEIERRLDCARDGGPAEGAALVAEWRRRSLVLGRSVVVTMGKVRLEGRAADIQPDGALVLDVGGRSETIYSGRLRLATGERDPRSPDS